jgi:hypothetical protein
MSAGAARTSPRWRVRHADCMQVLPESQGAPVQDAGDGGEA